VASVATDNFNRANSTGLGVNWTAPSGKTSCNVYNNIATGPSGAGYDYYSGVSFGADQYCRGRVAQAPNAVGRWVRVGVRTGGANGAGYWLQANDTNCTLLYTDTSGTDNTIESIAVGFGTSDLAEIRAIGTTISAYKNGKQIDSGHTDSNLSSGSPGIACFDNNSQIDDVIMGDTSLIMLDGVVTVTNGTGESSGTYTSSALTIAANSNRLLIACFAITGGSSGQDADTVTWDSVALTEYISINNATHPALASVWYLKAPNTGNKVFSFHLSGNCACEVNLISLFNVNQTTPIRGSQTSTGSTATPNMTIASAVNDIIIDCASSYYSSPPDVVAGTDQVFLSSYTDTGGAEDDIVDSSMTPGSASESISWTLGAGARNWAYAAISVEPSFTSAKPTGPFPTFRPDLS